MRTATATQQRPTTTTSEKELLDRLLTLPVGEKTRQVEAALDNRIEEIEALLPDFMKGQGARLIKRARLTFAKSAALQKCSPASFIKCVLEAAELADLFI